MQLKTSLLNKGILKNSFKRFYWMGVLYFIALFLLFPLSILLRLPVIIRGDRFYDIEGLFNFRTGPFQHFLIYIVPVLLAILLFNYLQNKSANDMIHSLPIKRSSLYANHVLLGLLLLTIPVILTALICWALKVIYLTPYAIELNIGVWAGTTILMNSLIFLSTVFAGVVTGVSIAQGVLTYIVLLLPTGLLMLVTSNLETLLFGFRSGFYNRDSIIRLSPLIKIAELYRHPLTLKNVIGYIIFSVAIYFLGQYLYNKRKLERGSQVIVFRTLNHLFKYGVTFSFMVLFGVYIYNVHGGKGWMLLGYLAASLFGYIVAEAIIQKSVRIFNKKTFRGYLTYFALMTIVLVTILFDFTGYTSRVPQLDEIEAVYFNNGFYAYHSGQYNNTLNRQLYITPDNIEIIQGLHQKILKESNSWSNENVGYYNPDIIEISLVYHLQNGKKIARGYRIDQKNYEEYIKPLRESLEDKVMKYDVLSADTSKVEKLTFEKVGVSNNDRLTIVDPVEIQEAIEIIKQEIRNADYDDLYDMREPWAYLDLMLEDDQYSNSYRRNINFLRAPWHKNFEKFEAWLQEKGYLERARVMPEEISYVLVEEIESGEDFHNIYTVEFIETDKSLKVIDKEEIEEILLSYYTPWRNNRSNGYTVRFVNERNEVSFFGTYDTDNAPSFIKNYFQ
ncbi:DUF6449 domain-containing protein [Alkaliphilus transvaalensis]|uniref:DUF6449 domain-containing protein n=1 Tax=Alkaliphilus transvaalensis TaxID=114628 RepID=UPI000479366C|nr:DUF6449 domain-containing protein [Alkaliphilus transvaalensis]